jgi:hypothetical protein
MNTKHYVAPTIESESICVEMGIAVSTYYIIDQQLFNDIYITEEEVEW